MILEGMLSRAKPMCTVCEEVRCVLSCNQVIMYHVITTNLIAFYNGMTRWVNERRAVDVVYLDFRKAFDTVSHNILVGKLRKCGLDEGGRLRTG